jgi:hypothetical protein
MSSLVYVLPLLLRYQIQHRTATLRRIAQDAFLIAEWRMIRPQSTRKAQMKTILMLIVGLMLAGCGSMENHVRNRTPAPGAQRGSGDAVAVDTICACP